MFVHSKKGEFSVNFLFMHEVFREKKKHAVVEKNSKMTSHCLKTKASLEEFFLTLVDIAIQIHFFSERHIVSIMCLTMPTSIHIKNI